MRGIEESNGNPPGNHLWNTYSMHKEDIWVSRARVPVAGTVEQHVEENFDATETAADLEFWNLYAPQWAPISIVPDPGNTRNKCLELRDEEPYDYAAAERAFPESQRVNVEFRILVRQVGAATLDFEVQDRHGNRPMRLHLDSEWLAADLRKQSVDPYSIKAGQWLAVRLALDCTTQSCDLMVNDETRKKIPFAEKAETLERMVFRTGPWCGDVRSAFVDGQPATLGLDQEDLPGADEKVPLSLYLIDDMKTESHQE